MAMREQQPNRMAQQTGRNATTPRNPKVVKFQAKKPGIIRRIFRFFFRPLFIVPTVLAFIVAVCVLVYFWQIFSERIDKLLSGEIFTRSAGVYSSPKELRAGEKITVDELIAYLKAAGYVEKSQQADPARSRYSVDEITSAGPQPAKKKEQGKVGWLGGAIVEIEPGTDSKVDDRRPFAALKVQFDVGGDTIKSISDLTTFQNYAAAQLEPQLITSVTGADRAKRKVISFKDLPPHLVKAVTVTEDRTFFDHYGVNIRGILRALWRRYDSDSNSPIANQGGSSITQQLVKNLLLSSEKTWQRKLSEAYMSVILETRLSKEEIFTLYCNQIYLGQQSGFSINGVGEASESYFNKDVTQLTLSEAAFLAGIIRSPNRYNPYKDLATATSRRNQVLQSMAEAGAITVASSEEARATPLKVVAAKSRLDANEAPYFMDYVQNQLGDILADTSNAQHLRVYTTIDMKLQRAAYMALTKHLGKLDEIFAKRKKDKVEPGTVQAALVAINPKTGEVYAMVGGRDYTKSQLNRATDAMRQPGSVFKPFVYASALNTAYDPIPRIITAATTYVDEPKEFTFDNQTYKPGNFGDSYTRKPMTLRDALVGSKNVIAVEVAMEVTIGKVMALAAKAGMPRVEKAYPSMALGASEATPLQVASAYTAFASGGTRVTPVPISRVTTGNGTTVVAPVGQKSEALRPEVAYIMTDIMKDVVNRGTAAKLASWGFKNVEGKTGFAGKTGTSRDGWFAGFTPNVVCAVYVGFDDGKELGLTGGDAALPIWADFMKVALEEHPSWNGDWTIPDGVQKAEIDIRTGKAINEDGTTGPEPTPTPTPTEENTDATDSSDPSVAENPQTLPTVNVVPTEFRRKELFISGTVPLNTQETEEETQTEELPPDIEPNPTPRTQPFQEKEKQKPKTPE
jgi:penicillin-binding protein 1B